MALIHTKSASLSNTLTPTSVQSTNSLTNKPRKHLMIYLHGTSDGYLGYGFLVTGQ
jgi:hypothetical protein